MCYLKSELEVQYQSHWGKAKELEGLNPSLEVLGKTVYFCGGGCFFYPFQLWGVTLGWSLSLPLQSQEGNTSRTWLPSCTFEDPLITLGPPVSQAN